jgi:hypothetical protein
MPSPWDVAEGERKDSIHLRSFEKELCFLADVSVIRTSSVLNESLGPATHAEQAA